MGKLSKVVHNFHRSSFYTGVVAPYVKNHTERFIYDNVSKLRFGPAANVMDEEWDHLLILDACRYDIFREENWLSGRLEHRISKGSVTGEFVTKNFDATYPDTVYITANPHASRLIGDRFHDFFHVWQTHWDDDLNTVPPNKMSALV